MRASPPRIALSLAVILVGFGCSAPPVQEQLREKDAVFRNATGGNGVESASGSGGESSDESGAADAQDEGEIDLQSAADELDGLLGALEATAAANGTLKRLDLQRAEELLTLLRSSPDFAEAFASHAGAEARYDALEQ